MHDNLGELYYANGDMFRGEWNADRATGYGVLIYANNNRYEGNWLDDKRHGHGVFHHADGSKYDGEWAAGRKEGKGTLSFANGDSFAGFWSAGVISGPGQLTLHAASPWNAQYSRALRLQYCESSRDVGDLSVFAYSRALRLRADDVTVRTPQARKSVLAPSLYASSSRGTGRGQEGVRLF
eukprot:scaffold182840_cov35-Tisochrysis_lutea.AAC.1